MKRDKWYILDDDHNVIAADLLTWAHWLEDNPSAREAVGQKVK